MDESSLFYGVLFALLLLEHAFPRSETTYTIQRWKVNFSLLLFAVLFSWLTKSLTVLFINEANDTASTIVLVCQFILIDLFYYVFHRLSHNLKLLWAMHLVHHSDNTIDLSTQFRHHPSEIIIGFVLFIIFAWALRLSPNLVAIYGIVASLIAMWHHSNVRLPVFLDNLLAYIIVTPSFHRVHHLSTRKFTDSNYGTVFTFWDRLFQSYQQPNQQANEQHYGLDYFNQPEDLALLKVVRQPLDYLRRK